MSINLEQLKQVLQTLSNDSSWLQVDPEIQKELLDELKADVGTNILQSHIDAVKKPKRKQPRKREVVIAEPQ